MHGVINKTTADFIKNKLAMWKVRYTRQAGAQKV